MENKSANFLDLSLKYKMGMSFDTFVVGEDGFVFKAHELTLSKKSGYFKEFFDENTSLDRKNNPECITINLKFRAKVLRGVFHFLYSGKTYLSESNVCGLAEAADFLQIDGLVRKCRDFMLEKLAFRNCASFLNTSYSSERLGIKERCFRFVCTNFNNIAQRSDSYIKKLSFVVFHDLVKENSLRVTDEYDVWKAIVSWVANDRPTRLKDVPELLSRIRWSDLSSQEISSIAEHKIFKNNEFCRDVKLEQLIKTSENECKQVTGRLPSKIHLFCRDKALKGKSSWDISCITDSRTRSIYITYDEEINICREITETSIDDFDCLITEGQFIFKFNRNKNVVAAYDLVREEWISKSPIGIPLNNAHFVRCKNVFFAVSSELSSVQYYDPSTDEWIKSAPLPSSLCFCAATALKDRLCVVGFTSQMENMRAVVYDVASDVWSDIAAPTRFGVIHFGLITFRERLYILGGISTTHCEATRRVVEYRPETDEWVDFPPLPFLYEFPQAVIESNKLIVYQKDFPSTKCPRCTAWNEETKAWDVLDFAPLEAYKIFSLKDESVLKILSKRNKDPRTLWDTSVSLDEFGIKFKDLI